jgi:hypothetical protein
MQLLQDVLGSSRVLCANLEGKTSFFEALIRAGVPAEACGRFFVERSVTAGRNSNLMSVLGEEAKICDHLLYAWDGLRTLTPAVKRKFKGKAYEAQTGPKVIEIFRKWLLSESKRLAEEKAAAEASEGD